MPPFIPHDLLGQWLIVLWMVATGHVDWPTVRAIFEHHYLALLWRVPLGAWLLNLWQCFDY